MSTDDPTYRVYTPGELQSIAPTTFRSGPPPPSRGFFAVGFVLAVCLLIGGGSFTALRFLNVDLTNGRTSLGTIGQGATSASDAAPADTTSVTTTSPAAPVALAPASPAASAATTPVVKTSTTASATVNASKLVRRKVRGVRHTGAPAVPGDPTVALLPPNPFDVDDRGSLSALKAATQGSAP